MNIKQEILHLLSNKIECPNCKKYNLEIGQSSLDFKSIPVLFCGNCLYRITIIMIENEANIARDQAGIELFKLKKYKKGTVLIDKITNNKYVVINPEISYHERDFEYVCDRPHADGDFSYLCTNEYCRCMQ